MSSALLVKAVLVVVGLVVGGGVTFGVVKLTESSTTDETTTSSTSTMTLTTARTTTTTSTTAAPSTTEESTTTTNGSRVVDTLQYIVLVSRHGNRGGSHDYVNDPYPLSNSTYWPYGANALTTYGRLQAYNLGKKMRSLYNGFLPAIHDADDVYPTSDSVERVIFSGECVITGLYPPSGWQVFSEELAWQPITHYTDSPDNSIGVNQCKKYTTEKATTLAAFLAEYQDNVTALIDLVYNATGTTYSMSDLDTMFDKVITEDTDGFVLPDWVQKFYPEPFSTIYGAYYLAITAGSDEITRIYAGALYDEIVSNMKNVIAGTSSRLMYYYSGHDSTILNMQVAYGVNRTDVKNPVHVGSGLILELHKDPDTSEYFIEVLFIDGASSDLEPTALTLSSCGDPCYYDNFINVTYSRFSGFSSTECNS